MGFRARWDFSLSKKTLEQLNDRRGRCLCVFWYRGPVKSSVPGTASSHGWASTTYTPFHTLTSCVWTYLELQQLFSQQTHATAVPRPSFSRRPCSLNLVWPACNHSCQCHAFWSKQAVVVVAAAFQGFKIVCFRNWGGAQQYHTHET